MKNDRPFARKLAATMFLEAGPLDRLLETFRCFYRSRTSREPDELELDLAREIIELRNPPPSASSTALVVPDLVTVDFLSKSS